MSLLTPNVYDGLFVGRNCGAVSYVTPRTHTPRDGPIPGSTNALKPHTVPAPITIVPRTGAVPAQFWEKWEARATSLHNLNPRRPMTATRQGRLLKQSRAARPLSARVAKLHSELNLARASNEDQSVLEVVDAARRNETVAAANATNRRMRSAGSRPVTAGSRQRKERTPPKTRVVGISLTEDQRRRAHRIMLKEDAAAATFNAKHRSFDTMKIISSSVKTEMKRNYVAAKRAESELVWAELRMQQTEEKIAALQEEMSKIRERPTKRQQEQ